MNIFKSGEETSLSIDPRQKINKFAFDGYHYYFTSQYSCEIVKLDSCLCFAGCCAVRRPYDCICYDSLEDCFWASSQNSCGAVFKLDRNLTEIDRLTVCGCRRSEGTVTGLSYNCCRNTLVVAYPNCIVEVDKRSGQACVQYQPDGAWITGILSLCPGYLITCVEGCRQFLYIMDGCGNLLNRCRIDCDLVVNNLILNPCVSNYPQLYLEFLVMKKGCYPYLYRRTLLAEDLGFIPDPCNYERCGHPCRECGCDEA